MDFTVTLEGFDKFEASSRDIQIAVAEELAKGLYASGKQVEAEAKKSILSGGKSGRIYTRRSITHQASAPGEAPASDTGRLVNSINTELTGPLEATIRAGGGVVGYANMLEFGTTKMAARPFMFPALEKSKQFIIERLTRAFQIGLNRKQ